MLYKDSAKWFTAKLIELQAIRKERMSVTDFAEILGKSQATISTWLNGTRKPNYQNAVDIATKLQDPSILSVLGYRPPSGHSSLPEDFRRRLDAAEEEANRILEERGLTGEMPEAETIVISIFEKWGFKYVSTETVDDGKDSSTK